MFGKGTKLHRKGGSNDWKAIGKVVNVTPPVLTREAIDVSYLNDTSLYKDYIAGVHEGGDMTVELHLVDPAASANAADASNFHDLVFADHTNGTKATYCIEFPSKDGIAATGKWKFECLVTSIAVTTPMNEKLLATVTMKVVGQPSFTTAALNTL